ncbi:MAG: family acetyltransferase [Nevskia sp.]|nr:family acetyltransferase [Nevskia sp.]
MDTFTYRCAEAHDCALLARFNQQLIAERGDTGSSDFAELLKRMQTWLSTRRYAAVLFDNERRQTVAYALYREHRREIYLRQFLVTRSARRHGYGRRAIELLQSKIWTPGKRLTVEVLVENQPAYCFWRSMGYQNYAVTLEIPPKVDTGVDKGVDQGANKAAADAPPARAHCQPTSLPAEG